MILLHGLLARALIRTATHGLVLRRQVTQLEAPQDESQVLFLVLPDLIIVSAVAHRRRLFLDCLLFRDDLLARFNDFEAVEVLSG